jgi:hypothetical protein
MIISPSGGITDTNQTGRSPATAQDYADINNPLTALARHNANSLGIIRCTA